MKDLAFEELLLACRWNYFVTLTLNPDMLNDVLSAPALSGKLRMAFIYRVEKLTNSP